MRSDNFGRKFVSSAIALVIAGVGAITISPIPVAAQLELIEDTAPDRNLGTRVGPSNVPEADFVSGGTRPQNGPNVFHSFQEFNVRENRGVYFESLPGVRNILTRITGNDPSDILGTLGVAGTANLFFINPNGIIFGRNASLDLRGGSFYGTTASGIKFGDVGEFSAVNPQPPSNLLTINPSAFFFTARPPGAIVNESRATQTVLEINTDGLQVRNGQTLLLLGGNVTVDGGRMFAREGRVEVGSVAAAGDVRLKADGSLSVPDELQRSDVTFTNNAFVDVRRDKGGDINVTANNINILENSELFTGIFPNRGTANSQTGNLILNATGFIQVTEGSIVANRVGPNATGNGGDLLITANSLEVRDGAQLQAVTQGIGDAGNVVIKVRDRVLFNRGDAFSTVEVGALGKGGNVQIFANDVEIWNGAQLQSSTRGVGNAGNVIIDARGHVLFSGTSADGTAPSAAFSRVQQGAFGKGGDVQVSSNTLEVRNGAQLSAGTFGNGNAGNVVIKVRDRVLFSGRSTDGQFNSTAESPTGQEAQGQGGNVQIDTNTLEVLNGAQLVAATLGFGDAGNVIIHARDRVLFSGRSTDGSLASGAFSRVGGTGNGNAGNVQISTKFLEVIDGARLNANTFGTGNAGNILIDAGEKVVFRGISVTGENSAAFSNVGDTGRGRGGNIKISTPVLEVRDRAELSANTFGVGDAGNIIIDARDHVLFSNQGAAFSAVEAKAHGQGGNVQISTSTLDVLSGSQLIASTTGTGAAGNVIIKARDRVLFDRGDVFSSVQAEAQGQGGNVQISTNSLEILNGAQLIATTAGIGDAGNVIIEARDRVLLSGISDNGQFPSAAFSNVEVGAEGRGGDVQISTNSLEVLDGAQLIASTEGLGNAGNVIIKARDRVLFDNGAVFSSVQAEAQGQGGNVQISTNSLEILNGAQLIAVTLGTGDAGNVVIEARDSVLISGTEPRGQSSGLFAFTRTDGQGGNITVNTHAFQVSDGAIVDARTRGSGDSGDVKINAATVEILNGGQVLAITQGSGRAGNIMVNASDRLTIAGTDPTYATRLAQFKTRVAPINASSGIYVRSQDQGGAGDITVTAPQIRMDQGVISAESAAVDGGNINLNVGQFLIMRNGSRISATAGTAQQGGNGGNITINTPRGFLVSAPKENNDITANAFTGSGGSITINAQGLYWFTSRSQADLARLLGSPPFDPSRLSTNDITASSDLGISGTVTLNTLNVDPSRGLTQLPQNLIDTNRILANSCIVRDPRTGGTFLITGSGGLPVRPGDALLPAFPTGTVQGLGMAENRGQEAENSPSLVTGHLPLSGTSHKPQATSQSTANSKSKLENNVPTVEAQGIYRLPDGQLVLSWECGK